MTTDDLLDQLQATFPAGAASGTFDAGDVADGEYASLLAGLGIPSVLTLTSPTGWQAGPGGVVTLAGVSLTPVLGVEGPAVYFQFTPTGGGDFVLLLDVALHADWTFPRSFRLLTGGVFSSLRLAAPEGSPPDAALVVASGPATDPLRVRGSGPLAVSAPLTFTGTFDVSSSAWAAVAWVAEGGAPGAVTGPVAYVAETGAVEMRLPLATGTVPHVLGDTGPSLTLELSLFSGLDAALGQYTCGVRFDTVLAYASESGAEEALDLWALLTAPDQGILDLTASGSALAIPSPSALAQWFGPGNGIAGALPDGVGDGTLARIDALTLGIGLASRTLEYASLTVSALPGEVWVIWRDVLEVGDLGFLFNVYAPLGDAPSYAFSFRGLVELGNVPIRVQGRLPERSLTGALDSSVDPPSVAGFVESVFGFTPGIPESLVIAELDFAVDLGHVPEGYTGGGRGGEPGEGTETGPGDEGPGGGSAGFYSADIEIEGSWLIPFGDENVLELEDLRLAVQYDDEGAAGSITGVFRVDVHEFTIALDVAPGDVLIRGVWTDDGEPLDYLQLAIILGMYGLANPPQVLDLAFTGASFQLESAGPSLALSAQTAQYGSAAMVAGRGTSGGWGFVFGMEAALGLSLDLTEIPVVGDLVPSGMDVIALEDLRIVAATTTLPVYTESPELAEIFGGVVNSGLVLSVELRVGTDYRQAFSVRFGGADDGTQYDTPPPPPELPEGGEPPEGLLPGEALSRPMPATNAVAPGVTPPAPPATVPAGPQYNWVEVQRAFGPVQFRRIGFSITAEDRLALALDGSVSLAGLTIALTGLSAEIPIESPYLPTFGLAGLAVEYAAAGLEIGGALVKVPGMDPAEYTGDLVLEVERFGALAFGSYTTVGGSPSLFGFVFLDAPLGGPGCFFVTGLSGGFGFNRTLRLPTIDTVATYPLVQGAMGTLDARSTIDALDAYIQPAPNQYWFAAGIRFTSYGLLRSYALATVSFGATVEVGLMGESTLALPPVGGEEGEGALQPIAEADLVLLVDVVPASGTLAVAAQLSPASYVLSRDARLTGGFAFYLWFPPSPHAGDFVVSLGGYNPYFDAPAHYPAVPRLGFAWTLSTELSITGGVYCALTPGVVMAGGSLKAAWSGGGLTASFTAEADFLVRLRPFAYDARVAVSVGVSYRIDLGFTAKTVSVQVSGEVDLWGQPFGGHAWVDAGVVSFSLDFGAPRPGPAPDLDWPAFRGAFLPPVESSVAQPATEAAVQAAASGGDPAPTATDALVALHAPSGLLGTFTDGGDTVWRVDPAALRLVVATQVPSKTAAVSTAAPPVIEGSWSTAFGIGPMGVAPADLAVALSMALQRGGAPDGDAWSAAAVTGNVPAGVWLSTSADMDAPAVVEGVLTGIELVPVVPPPDVTVPVDVATLLGDQAPVRALAWSSAVPATRDGFDQADALGEMQRTLVDPAVSAVRASILAALRAQGMTTAAAVDVAAFAAQAPELMSSPPQLRVLGETPAPFA